MASANTKSVSVTTTGVAIPPNAAPGGAPFATYALQVKGVGAAPTSWSVTLDVSIDGVNWTTLITHNSTDGSTSFDPAGKPSLFYRVNVASLSLGSATAIAVSAIAAP